MGWIENIPMIVKNRMNAADLHQWEIIITVKEYIPSIVNTLKEIIIARYVYE